MNRKWRLRLGLLVSGYLVLWVATWLFAPSAVSRLFGEKYTTVRDAQGNDTLIDVRERVHFIGEGFDFWPDPMPSRAPWACVGPPVIPIPFVVYADYAYVKGGLDGGAGRVYFFWTPWKLYWLGTEGYWSA